MGYRNLEESFRRLAAQRHKNITIVQMFGAIGCGKSTIVSEIEDIVTSTKHSDKFKFVREKHLEIDGSVSEYYAGLSGAAKFVELEHVICGDRLDTLVAAIEDAPEGSIIITDRSILEDITFIRQYIDNEMDKNNPQECLGLMRFADDIESVDYILGTLFHCLNIRVETPYEVCKERTIIRGREFERTLTAEKIENLDKYSELYVEDFPKLDGEFHPRLNASIILLMLGKRIVGRNICVSVYGLPGSGKSTVCDRIWKMLPIRGFEYLYDNSDTKSRRNVMRGQYSEKLFDGSALQCYLDIERIGDLKDVMNGGALITDIGAATSKIFSRANDIKVPKCANVGDGSYKDLFDSLFMEIPFVLSCSVDTAVDGIKSRNRNGEESLPVQRQYLERVDSEIHTVLPDAHYMLYDHASSAHIVAQQIVVRAAEILVNMPTNYEIT